MLKIGEGISIKMGLWETEVPFFFNAVTDIDEFNYLKAKLMEKHPEMAALTYDTSKSLIQEIAEIKKVPMAHFELELKKESVYSYLIDYYYRATIDEINKRETPMRVKEKLTKLPISSIVARRMIKVFLAALIVGAGMAGLVTFMFCWLWWPLMICVGLMFWVHDSEFRKILPRIEEWLQKMSLGGL